MGTPQKRPRLFGKDEVGGSNLPATPVKALIFKAFFFFPEIQIPLRKAI